MAISVIRKMTEADTLAVQTSAMRFCDRHGLTYDSPEDALSAIAYEADPQSPGCDQNRIRSLWTRCLCRSLKVPVDHRVTIAYGYIGLRIEP